MELYLDTSDVVAVKALSRIFPLAGVTTNPSIIAAGKKPLDVVLPQLHEAMGGQGRLFAQVMATTAEGMVNDALKLRSIIADIVVKVPVTAEGLAASFKTPRQALDCLLAGCESITLPLDVAQQMISYPAVDAAVAKFEQDWQGAFGRTSI
ncbi:TPA: transaldolase family protein [Escherichia coli]|uniref:transaldolase family protein n=1 Tax=Escherichia coli TaxID=562 RepID=UPI0017ABFF16|nr:transaldolase family protein [Escherichia coli]EJN1753875.1 hypothetical protein [Escherichia coli]MBC0532575.1 hypothetical protein [Escherichia coli]MBW9518583.1 hypothetical protein [Escherichia coli]MCZ0176590.1 hypothetical protein [Escherichia coli]MCZ0252511.1 hypothetical protein [Escherichia coli]